MRGVKGGGHGGREGGGGGGDYVDATDRLHSVIVRRSVSPSVDSGQSLFTGSMCFMKSVQITEVSAI